VDVGGNATLGESLEAVRIDGVVVLAGLLGKTEKNESLMSLLGNVCIGRGILLGTREMMRDMIAFIAKHALKPAVDNRVFALSEAQEAYRRLEAQEHFSKVIIRIQEKGSDGQ